MIFTLNLTELRDVSLKLSFLSNSWTASRQHLRNNTFSLINFPTSTEKISNQYATNTEIYPEDKTWGPRGFKHGFGVCISLSLSYLQMILWSSESSPRLPSDLEPLQAQLLSFHRPAHGSIPPVFPFLVSYYLREICRDKSSIKT